MLSLLACFVVNRRNSTFASGDELDNKKRPLLLGERCPFEVVDAACLTLQNTIHPRPGFVVPVAPQRHAKPNKRVETDLSEYPSTSTCVEGGRKVLSKVHSSRSHLLWTYVREGRLAYRSSVLPLNISHKG